jgi:phasin family protein
MIQTPEQFTQVQKLTFETFQSVALKSLEGFEKLAELNMQALKSSLEESADQMRTMMTAKDPRALGDWSMAAAQPAADKMAAYAKHVYDIASGTSTEIAKVVEKQLTESNKQISASIDAMAKSAPAGSEGMVTLLKTAVSAANSAYEQVNKATKQAVEAAEANLVAAAKAARPAAPRKAA